MAVQAMEMHSRREGNEKDPLAILDRWWRAANYLSVGQFYLMTRQPESGHQQGLSDRDFDTLFTRDRPIIFAYHGNVHVRGYKKQGTTTAPVDICVLDVAR